VEEAAKRGGLVDAGGVDVIGKRVHKAYGAAGIWHLLLAEP
jgi:hypothetical protein